VDGVWDEWGDWGACDEQCGEGRHIRQRQALTPAQYGGKLLEGPSAESKTCKDKECPIDCEVSAWEKETDCDVTCGGGYFTMKRTITVDAQHEGAACPADLEKQIACAENPCPVDCVLTDFAPVSACSVSCGEGTLKEQRTIETPQAHNGKPCDAPLEKDVECSGDPCPVDCVWGQWSGFGTCSETCGEGSEVRTRGKEIEAAEGGAECEGEEEQTRTCELTSCPIDGAWGEWEEWGSCSETCGPGDMIRSRVILTPAQFGGQHAEGNFDEIDECEDTPCPVDCVMSEWEAADECSASCGGGTYTETRTVGTEADFGAEPCPTDNTRTVACNEQSCPIDCELGDWFDDGSCTVSCGGGKVHQKRTIQVAPAFGGVTCEVHYTDEARMDQIADCNTQPCPIDCVFEEWTGWSSCSEECGMGNRTRTRGESISADHGGEACEGEYEEMEVCMLKECPVHCVFSAWSDWGSCSEPCDEGLKTRTRFEETPARFGGTPCEGTEVDTADCVVEPCPVDCVMNPWEDDAAGCSKTCGGGDLVQHRGVQTAKVGRGAECPAPVDFALLQGGNGHVKQKDDGSQSRTIKCSIDACPIDCVIEAEWKPEGSCSKSCGTGTLVSRKAIEVQAAHGGVACPAEDSADREKTEDCNTDACPVDCVVSQWTGWGQCSTSCGEGSRTKTRSIETEAADGGVACPSESELTATEACTLVECPIHCVVGEWGPWDECTTECGPGKKSHSRPIATEAEHGGDACTEALTEDTDCENDPCPVDCELSEWTDEAAGCSKTCGGGSLKQTRTVTVEGNEQGAACDAAREQTIDCNTEACPVDCELEDWKDDGGCSVSCGGGKQIKRKAVSTQSANGGIACPASEEDDRYKEEDCNADACPVDCVLSAWGAWSSCSVTCGDGVRNQSRTVETEPANGGVECEETFKEESCKLVECPIMCEVADWSDWTPCSVECGESGWRERSRGITTDPLHGGTPCPELYANVTECPGLVGCPVNCELGEWTASDCSTTCGEGTYGETREVLVEPKNSGNACGPTERVDLPCEGLPLCPVDCEVSDWSASGTCSKQCGGGKQTWTMSIMTQAVGDGAACPTAEERIKEEECNTEPCPGTFVGETGAKAVSMNTDMAISQIKLNVAYDGAPVVITGPLPARGDKAKEVAGRVVVMSVRKDVVEVEKAADEVKPEKEDACKCIGGPSAAVPMGANNVQYPQSYGDYCSAWSPRDPAAAAAADGQEAELTYLGDGYAYNSVSKMRVYVYNDVDPTKQTVGEPVVLPEGASIPDFPGEEGTSFAPDGSIWCYTAAECSVATSDGWGTWASCEPMGAEGKATCFVAYCNAHQDLVNAFCGGETCGAGAAAACEQHWGEFGHKEDRQANPETCASVKAWDDKPPVMYPEATVCPLGPYYGGSPPGLSTLTYKYDATTKDSCVGKADHNDCHDPSGFGGANIGMVSSLDMNGTMVMLQRAYNPEAKDTCVFHEGAMETFCKATVGEYGAVTDLGYVFEKAAPGTVALKAYWDSIEEDSCASTNEDTCPGVIEGTLGYVFDEVAADAWAQCGVQPREDRKWVVTLVTKMDASPDATSPMTEKVPWIAMKQGVFTTSNGKMIQAGVARIPADEEFHPIKFFQSFPSAPAVFVSNLDPVDVMRLKGETEAEFTASANAGFEDIESHGACAWKENTIVSAAEGNSRCQASLDNQACVGMKGKYTVNEEYTHHWRAPACHTECWNKIWGGGQDCMTVCTWWDVDHYEQRWRTVEKEEPYICVYNEWVIGKCRGATVMDWGTCKQYVTSETECTSHPECVWETIAGEHTKPLVEVHWLAVEKTEEGVLGAYPFIAGDTSVGDETVVSFDAGFTQVPLVYGFASGEAKADVRVTAKDVGNFSMIVQGAEADEKVSYLVYNGQSSVGTAFKAVATSLISYAYETADFGECEDDGSGISGTRTRTVDCLRSDGETADDYYCAGEKPHETEACTLVRFYVMSMDDGLCLGPEDVPGKNGVVKKELAAKVEKCDGDKNKFKIQSGQDGGFKFINAATNMCYCAKGPSKSTMLFKTDCDSSDCNLERYDIKPDGSFKAAPVERGCIRSMSNDRTVKPLKVKDSESNCKKDGVRFTMVKEGTIEISDYAHVKVECEGDCYLCYCNAYPDLQNAFCGGGECTDEGSKLKCKHHWEVHGKMEGRSPNPETCTTIGYKGYYEDKSGGMLTDGHKLNGDFPSTPAGMKGVGGLEEFTVDFKLATPGPIQTVNVGFNFMKEWQVKKPKKVQVQCSSDGGSTFGNTVAYTGAEIEVKPTGFYKGDNGGRKVMTFTVLDICGEDTDSFRVTVTPQAGPKTKKAIIDEVTAFAPFTLG
jgi:hypothetical protein